MNEWQQWLDIAKQLNSNKQGLPMGELAAPAFTGVPSLQPSSKFAPKNSGGGQGLFGNASPLSMAAAGLNSVISSAVRPTEANIKFLERNAGIAKKFRAKNTIDDIRGQASSLAISTGNPIAMAVGAADTLGRTVDKLSKDEFGIYKSTGAQVADRILDPIGNITDIFTGGYDQKKLKKARDTFYNIETKNQIADVRDFGAGTQSLLPRYTAPSYGQRRLASGGMKLRTKFSM